MGHGHGHGHGHGCGHGHGHGVLHRELMRSGNVCHGYGMSVEESFKNGVQFS